MYEDKHGYYLYTLKTHLKIYENLCRDNLVVMYLYPVFFIQ